MKLDLYRLNSKEEDSIGVLYIDGEFECFTVEDEARDIKIKGETRIPSGKYWITFREVESPATLRYRSKYSFFKYHLMLQDVNNFDYIYIHPGVDESHTDGCILIGDSLISNVIGKAKLGYSSQAYERIYKLVSNKLESCDKVQIEVHNNLPN